MKADSVLNLQIMLFKLLIFNQTLAENHFISTHSTSIFSPKTKKKKKGKN